MFQFPAFASGKSPDDGIAPAGLPHSDIRGSRDICSSPRLFAACHVLLRLREPRHPPYALSNSVFPFLPYSPLFLRFVQGSSSPCIFRLLHLPFLRVMKLYLGSLASFSTFRFQYVNVLRSWQSSAHIIPELMTLISGSPWQS